MNICVLSLQNVFVSSISVHIRFFKKYTFDMFYIKNKIESFAKDKFLLINFICLIGYLILTIILLKEKSTFELKLKIISLILGLIIAIIFERKRLCIYWTLYTLVFLHFTPFYKSYYFIVILINIIIYPKSTIPILTLYFFNILIIAQSNHLDIVIVVYHLITVLLFYSGLLIIKEKFQVKTKTLKLNLEEEKILDYLANGCCQYDIPGYSESTIKRKLKRIKERNNIFNTKELIELFIKEFK